MSVNYYARMVAGFLLSASDMEVVEKIRACNHKETQGANFCPVCGKPMFVENKERKDFESPSGKFRSYDSNTVDFERDVGMAHVVGLDLKSAFIPDSKDLSILEEELRKECIDQGIRVKTPFAIYLVKYVSY